MGNIDKPILREEMYYSYLLGDTSITLPEPITRRDRYLYELCKKGAEDEPLEKRIKALEEKWGSIVDGNEVAY